MRAVGHFLLNPAKEKRMLATVTTSQTEFYKEFLMGRRSFDPHDFGVDLGKETFLDQMVEDFGGYTRGQLTLDELLLRPKTALHFCDTVRQMHGYFDLPDDIILRSIMQRRKNP